MGGGTGPADLATAGPVFAVWCPRCQQMRSQRSYIIKFKKSGIAGKAGSYVQNASFEAY